MIAGDSRNTVLSYILLKEWMVGPEFVVHFKDAADVCRLIIRQDFYASAYPEISQLAELFLLCSELRPMAQQSSTVTTQRQPWTNGWDKRNGDWPSDEDAEAHIREGTLTASDDAPEAFGDFDIRKDTSDKFHFRPCQYFHSVECIHKKNSLICNLSFLNST